MKVKINPDIKIVKEVRSKIKENDGYCPCKILKTDDTKCICTEFKMMIHNGELGMCHCGLYIIE